MDLAFSKWYVQQYSYDTIGRTFTAANAPRLRTVLDRRWATGHPLWGVTIKCQQFRDTLRAEGQTCLDPTHWRCLGYHNPTELYRVTMTEAEHRELAALLAARPGPWVMCIDDLKEVRGLYRRLPGVALRRVGVRRNMGYGVAKRPVTELVVSRP